MQFIDEPHLSLSAFITFYGRFIATWPDSSTRVHRLCRVVLTRKKKVVYFASE